MPDQIQILTFLTLAGIGIAFLVAILFIIARFYRKVDQGRVLIVNTMRAEPTVTFTGMVVIPIIHRAEVMDISVKTIEIDRRGKEGLICRDNIRADIKVSFFVRVNKKSDDVLKVAGTIGCVRASDQDTLELLFNAKFSEALKTVGKRLDFEELYTKRDDFKTQIIEVIGQDLNGYALDDCAIDFLEQTPLSSLDPQNVLDSHGIQKITRITAEQNIRTNDLKQDERKAITKKNVEAEEAILELKRQESDARAKQGREIATIQARETAETMRVQAEEHKKAELARIKMEEEVAISNENKLRQVEIARKNKERAVLVETERVEKERALEAISRERETELMRIEKEKALEVQRKEIAETIAARVSVERNVAQEEENIKDLRVVAESKRIKEATIIGAEAEAQEHLVKEIKAAEAAETVAKHQAKQRLILAEADLEASDKTARAKMRLAEGTQAETAATGLAEVRVKEADAVATEKMGFAHARVQLEGMQAQAKGEEEQGMARVRVREADAMAIAKQGQAEASARREMLVAEAQGKEADASAVEKMGAAHGAATRARMEAEAAGLAQKAIAMKELEGVGREHEEFRLRLDKMVEVELAKVAAQREIAGHQAQVMSTAMGNAKLNIVGGDGRFFDQFVKAVSVGASLDAGLEHSATARHVLRDYIDGDGDLVGDIKEVLMASGANTESLKNLGVVALLRALSAKIEDGDKGKLDALIARAQELGLR